MISLKEKKGGDSMAASGTTSYIEKITHQTQHRPFSLHHTIVHPNEPCALYLHCHSEMEFFYLEKGKVTLQVEEKDYFLQEGDAVFIPPNLLHSSWRACGLLDECSFYAVVFSREMIMDCTPSYCEHYFEPIFYSAANCSLSIKPDVEWKRGILTRLKEVFSQFETKIEDCELLLRGNLLIIWQLLYNEHLSQISSQYSSSPMFPQLIKSVDFISSHFTDSISLKTLARDAGLSEGHFCRLFKEFTGFTPFQYINRKRITKSCEYLSKTNKKIAEVAVLCGYNNISYYNRIFLRIMKETPSSYRKHFLHSEK